MKKKTGTTVIELLVLIMITAILGRILWPLFIKAQERAQIASCQSNLKQLAIAGLMYAEDYDGNLPPAIEEVNFFDATFKYFKHKNATLVCPSYRAISSVSSLTLGNLQFGYGANANVSSIKQLENTEKATIPLLADTKFGKPWFTGPKEISCRHDGYANIAFADGHAKNLPRKDFTDFVGKEVYSDLNSLTFSPKVLKPPPTAQQKEERDIKLTDPDGSVWIGTLRRQ